MLNEGFAPIVKAYIDPGTGSMLFTVLIGLISAGIYAFRGLLIKLKSFSKKDKTISNNSIPFLIYSDSKRYWNVFKPICDEFESRGINLVYYTQSSDDPALSVPYKQIHTEFIGEGNKGIAKMNFVNAEVVLSTTPSLDVYQWKRSKNVKYYVHIPHACDGLLSYRMFGIDHYDAVLATSQFSIDQAKRLEKKRNLPEKDFRVAGLTYFDEMKKRLDNTPRVHNGIPVVLLAPSWGPSSLLNKYGEKIIDELIKTGYKIVVRPHPQSYVSEKSMLDRLMSKYPNIEWNKDNDNFDILNKADILMSDFSGVIFDYTLVFDKPVIYTNAEFDDSIYDAWWSDDKIWTFDILPYLGQEINDSNINNIKQVIDSCINDNKYQDGRNKARNEAWCNIGNSTKTIVDYLIDKQKEVSKK